MSAAAVRLRQEEDVGRPSRPTLAESRPTNTPTIAKETGSDESSNEPKNSGTKENGPVHRDDKSNVMKTGPYHGVDAARALFLQRAQKQNLEVIEPKLEYKDIFKKKGKDEKGAEEKGGDKKDKDKEDEDMEDEDMEDEDEEDEDEEDEEREKADEKQHDKLMKEGALNLHYRARTTKSPPEDISRIYTKIYPTVRNWWIKGQEQQHHERMEAINKEIASRNRLAKRNESEFLFPNRKISDYVSSARTILEGIRQLEAGPKRTNEAKRLLSGHTLFSNQLREEHGIDMKLLIPKPIRDELGTIFDMPGLEIQRKEFSDLLHQPTIKQKSILEPALELLDDYYRFLAMGDDNSMGEVIQKLTGVNERLRESNLSEGLKENDHILPIDHLRAINVAVDKEQMMSIEERNEVILTNSKRMKESLQCFGVSDASIPEQYTEGVVLPEEELRQMQQDAANFEGSELQESFEGNTTAEDEVNRQKERNTEKFRGHQSASNSSPNLMLLPQTIPLINDGVGEGITECGKVISVSKAGFGYRVFTNIGTDTVPVYKMFPGSSFPKSVRSFLYENFPSAPQPKKMEDVHIEILDTIAHPIKNGNYTWIVYKWMAEVDPKPRIMSHSDLARRLGRNPALRQEKRGLEARKKRLEILRSMIKSPGEVIAEGVPTFDECPPYMIEGLVGDEDCDV